MSPSGGPSVRVPRTLRWGSLLLTVLLALLFVWLLAFVLEDIGDLEGPLYHEILETHVDPSLSARADELRAGIAEIGTSVARQEELQEELARSMANARETMQQMMDLHRLSLERDVPPTEAQQEALAVAQQRFLDAQDRFESANAEIAEANARRFELRRELESVEETLARQEAPARREWEERRAAHRLRVAAWKLAFIVPVFLASAWAVFRLRRSPYRPIALAALVASFWELGRVMFEHFPREHFKYIAIVAAIGIVLAFLVWLLRKAARPGRSLLESRYREAYRSHVCPVCAHPIVRGPWRFAVWTRRGPRLPAGSDAVASAADESAYACPSCGTTLYSTCDACGGLRHALLPFCEHCGTHHEVAAGQPLPGGRSAGPTSPRDPP